MKTDTKEISAQIRQFNRWRRGDEALDQPHPKDIGKTLDAAADRLEELESELAELRKNTSELIVSLQTEMNAIERELAVATRSPYIDSDELPVEILAAIYDALDGITDDAANGYNFGTLVSRVKQAVFMATVDLAAERALADRLLAIAEKAVSSHEGTLHCDDDCKCSGRRIANDNNESLAAWKEARHE